MSLSPGNYTISIQAGGKTYYVGCPEGTFTILPENVDPPIVRTLGCTVSMLTFARHFSFH